MLNKKNMLIITYFTSSDAIATEKICKENNVKGQIISAPRKLTSDCGIAYKTDVTNKLMIENLLNKNRIEYENMVEMEI